MAAPSAPAYAPGTPLCAGCGARGAPLRCAGCRSALYCDRDCQKAAWPEHKVLCKAKLRTLHGGVQLSSARDFVLEYWADQLPPGYDADALLPPGDPLDEAVAFERCQGAAMDAVFPGYSAAATDGDRRRLVQARIARDPTARLGALAVACIWRVCPAAVGAVLDAGAQPGDSLSNGRTVLQQALVVLQRPYARSAAVLPHALASARRVLERAQPGDWLVGRPEEMPLQAVVEFDAPVLREVLGMIQASPGGFPARAVAATRDLLHLALLQSPSVFVEALLDAGADPNGDSGPPAQTGGLESMAPLHALAVAGGNGTPDFDAKLRLLLAAGARLEGVESHGWTPLVTAAVRGHAATFDALLAAGAQASALRVDFSGGRPASKWTLLHELAQSDNAAMLTRVLATGALAVDERAGRETSRNATPLLVAAEKDAARACAALLAAGASLAATDSNGSGALQTAVESSAPRAARLLLEAAPPKSALRAGYKRAVKHVVEVRRRAAAAAPGDADAAARLVAAHAVAALFE